jgi:hypothetical protein
MEEQMTLINYILNVILVNIFKFLFEEKNCMMRKIACKQNVGLRFSASVHVLKDFFLLHGLWLSLLFLWWIRAPANLCVD